MLNNKTVGIIGNPNVGKTYLFNRMTSCVGCVGNWAGVTATTCESRSCGEDQYRLLDLPGCYHLAEGRQHQATQGQQEVASYLSKNDVDLWLNVLDATNIQQQLYLTIQLLEAKKRVICVINRIDLLPSIQKEIDITELGRFLQVPIVKVSAKLGMGMRDLQSIIKSELIKPTSEVCDYPIRYNQAIEQLLNKESRQGMTRWQAWQKLIHADKQPIAPAWHFDQQIAELLNNAGTLTDVMALTRTEHIESCCRRTIKEKSTSRKDNDKELDRWFLHPWLGLPIFFMMMFTVFWLSMGCGQLLQGVLEPLLQLLTVEIPTFVCKLYGVPIVAEIVLVHGIGISLVTALSFFPVLLVMFFSLYFLEESGYMTRAAIVMDRIMRQLDLPGESMVALVLGLGCNVPGILATRHIPKKSDKIVTALMMPFMSCGARLTIFAVFASVFFPRQAASVLFSLYVLGISIAFLTGLIARYCGLTQRHSHENYLLEIPGYQWPSWSMGIKQAYQRTQRFVWRALGVIMPVCIALALCNHITYTGELLVQPGDQSILAWIGKSLSILFYPIGLKAEHWPLVVSLLMGLLAKEVVLTTLSVFYTQMNTSLASASSINELVMSCFSEIINNIVHGYSYFLPSLQAELPSWASYLNPEHISPDAIMSYLIFTLLYFPCVSTLYATARQTTWRWAGISVLWSTGVAYVCAAGYLVLKDYVTNSMIELLMLIGVLLVSYYIKERVKKHLAKKANKAEGIAAT